MGANNMLKYNFTYNFYHGYIVNYSLMLDNGAESIQEDYFQSLDEAKEFIKRIKKINKKAV
jgi:hypothetical protein